MKSRYQSASATTFRFVVEKLDGMFDFESVVDYTNMTQDQAKEKLLATGRYKSASMSDVFTGYADPHRCLTVGRAN